MSEKKDFEIRDGVIIAYLGTDGADVVIPSDVKEIGEYAFSASGIKSLTAYDTLSSIGRGAFEHCAALESVTLGVGLGQEVEVSINDEQQCEMHVGESAFASCGALKTAVLGAGVKEVGNRVFDGCRQLERVEIAAAETIGEYAFHGCGALKTVAIKAAPKRVGAFAFDGCTTIERVEFGGSLESWCGIEFATENSNPSWLHTSDLFIDGDRPTSFVTSSELRKISNFALYGCKSITRVMITDGVKVIGDKAFYSCSALKVAVIADTVESMGDMAFYNCSSLISAVVPDTAKPGKDVFGNCPNLKLEVRQAPKMTLSTDEFEIQDGVLKKYKGSAADVVVPDGVTEIGEKAFYICESLKSLTIPNTVRAINGFAINNCGNLTSVALGSGVSVIEYTAFSGCNSLTNITVASGNKKYCVRGNCLIETESKTLVLSCKNCTIPSDGSVTAIGAWAFRERKGLTSITIPDSVKEIGISAFKGCVSLTSVTIGNNVTSIGDDAFENCTALTSVTIGKSVLTIGDSAFRGCTALKAITIPESVNRIDMWAFRDCSSLTSITLLGRIWDISYSTFSGCSLLTSIEIPNSVREIYSDAFNGCSSLKSINIPNSVKKIGDRAFKDCVSLSSVSLNISIYSISHDLKEMGEEVFSGCENLKKIIIPAKTEIKENTFSGCPAVVERAQLPDSERWAKEEKEGFMISGNTVFGYKGKKQKLVIPDGIAEISGHAFANNVNIRGAEIPESVVVINGGAFDGCKNLIRINYHGTMKQWKKIKKKFGWDAGLKQCAIFTVDGQVKKAQGFRLR